MDYRSAGLIMLSALIMWVQHRHIGFALAQLASGAVEVGHQACLAAERERDVAQAEDSSYRLPSSLPARTQPLSVFQRGVSVLRRTLDELEEAGLLLGWQLLGDERPLGALLRARRP